MLKPLQQWICDVCGDVIEKADDGYVIWKDDDQDGPYDFKVIHHPKCDHHLPNYPLSRAVRDFLGVEGLTRMLSFLSGGPIRKKLSPGDKYGVRDSDEFVDLVRRFQIPFYEEARVRFTDSDILEKTRDWNEYAPYRPDELKWIASKPAE